MLQEYNIGISVYSSSFKLWEKMYSICFVRTCFSLFIKLLFDTGYRVCRTVRVVCMGNNTYL